MKSRGYHCGEGRFALILRHIDQALAQARVLAPVLETVRWVWFRYFLAFSAVGTGRMSKSMRWCRRIQRLG